MSDLTHAIKQVKLATQDLKESHPTDEELIDQAAKLCQEASKLHRELQLTKFPEEIKQNLDMLHSILNNLAGMRMSYYLEASNIKLSAGERRKEKP